MHDLLRRLPVFVLGCLLLGGCARPAATAVMPHDEELPVIRRPEQIVPAAIGVEGRRPEDVHVKLVPKFEEPELTEEEREALGIKPDPINWLEFYVPRPKVMRVWPGMGGGRIGAYGLGGRVSGVEWARRGASSERERPPVAFGYSAEARSAGHATRPEQPVSAAGSETSAGVRIGEGRATGVAGRETRSGK